MQRWRERMIAAGVWANEPVPLYPYPSSPSYRALLGRAGRSRLGARARALSPDASRHSATSRASVRCRCRSWRRRAGRRSAAPRPADPRCGRRRLALCARSCRDAFAARRRLPAGRLRSGAHTVPAGRGRSRFPARNSSGLTRRSTGWSRTKATSRRCPGCWTRSRGNGGRTCCISICLRRRRGWPSERPVIVASHSCVPTWWRAVRGTALPAEWRVAVAAEPRGVRSR